MWVGVITLVLGCLAVIEVGRRAAAGALPRNRIVGVRMRRTLESDEAWALVHRTAGSTLVGTGVAGIGLAVTAAAIGVTAGEGAAGGALVVAAVVVVLGVLVSVRLGLRALTDAERADQVGGDRG
jgi:uncharacterized membrane protein